MTTISDDQVKVVFQSLKKAYGDLDAPAFCKLLGLNLKWDQKYFISWQKGIQELFNLDDSKLIELIRYGEEKLANKISK